MNRSARCEHILGFTDGGGEASGYLHRAWNCGAGVSWDYALNADELFDFCPKCGIALDWAAIRARVEAENARQEAAETAKRKAAEQRREQQKAADLFRSRMRGKEWETWQE